MIFRPGIKINTSHLVVLAGLSLLLLIFSRLSEHSVARPEREKMLMAARQMVKADEALRAFRLKNGFKIKRSMDPLNSGFIGTEFSPITTTLGELKAKQTSTNPDFAALFFHWFHQLNIKRNGNVVIHVSGSFPSLTIAAIIASETYGLCPFIFSSGGASSFGANIPTLTYWDIEDILIKRGIIHHRTQYATPGGQNDNGSSFWEGGMKAIKKAALKNGLRLHIPKTLHAAIYNKLLLIKTYRPQLFINIGGNQAAMGNYPCSLQIPVGIIRQPLNCRKGGSGLIYQINKLGIPVIHLLQIREIALANGLSLSPTSRQPLGQAALYFTQESSRLLNAALFLILSFFILFFVRKRKKSE